jgi:hypothetical protein
MKKIVLDTKRNQVLLADEVRQDGDVLVAVCGGRLRSIQLDKVAYIEDVADTADVPRPRLRHESEPAPEQYAEKVPLPAPMLGAASQQIKLPTTFAQAVEKRLRDAPPPDPVDDAPPQDADARVVVELTGSTSGTYDVFTDSASLAAEHVKERLVSDIFSNAALKESLRSHNVVGITKAGNLVTLDCRQKPPVQPPAVSASVASLVNNIVGLVTPSVKLPDLPLQALNADTQK